MDDETKQALAVALPKASAWVKGAVRRDRANAYGLDAPWILPRLGGDLKKLDLMPPDYFGPGFHIADGVITELPFAVDPRECDGCTLAPDAWPESWGGVKAYVAAIFHDRWYRFMEAMARAWGWAVWRVRKLGDIIFGNILRSLKRTLHGWEGLKAEIACRTYYRGVRAFGGVAHVAYRRFAAAPLVAGCIALSGCAGCAIPNAWEDPDAEVQIPAHSYSNLVTGAAWKYEPPVGGNDGAAEGRNDGPLRGNDGAAEGRNDGPLRGNEEGAE
jgi:hypothetical protein